MGKHQESIDRKIVSRIHRRGNGSVFSPSDFHDLGSAVAVRLALMRAVRSGMIRRLARGLYDYPRIDPDLGALAPSNEAIARALRGREGIRLQPSGAHAAHLLGLTEQVPVRAVFLTDGPERRVRLGRREIVLRRTTPRNMATAGRMSGTVIQALRWLGRRHVDEAVVTALRQRLTDEDRRRLVKDLRYAPAWIADIMRRISRPEGSAR
jgi:hypothetical protein